MLSKVLSRRDAGGVQSRVQPIVYPLIAEVAGVARRPNTVSPGERSDTETLKHAALQEKQRQQEATAIERRETLEAGRRQGDQEARAELLPVMERLNASIAEITSMRADLRRRAERDVVQLALLIARRVLHRQLSVDDGALTAIARVAFERLTRSESYTVIVHPRFAAAVAAALPANQASRVRIEPDSNCDQGTLVIHSAEGVIDASVDAQLEEINRGLTDRLTAPDKASA